VLVHNHVVPQRTLGVNGFRAWTETLNDKLEVCNCKWAGVDLRGLVHYRVKGGSMKKSMGTVERALEVVARGVFEAWVGAAAEQLIAMEPGNTHLGKHAEVSLKVTLKKTADGKYLVETVNGFYARPDTNKASDRMIAALATGDVGNQRTC
jgi:hypothetical protein